MSNSPESQIPRLLEISTENGHYFYVSLLERALQEAADRIATIEDVLALGALALEYDFSERLNLVVKQIPDCVALPCLLAIMHTHKIYLKDMNMDVSPSEGILGTVKILTQFIGTKADQKLAQQVFSDLQVFSLFNDLQLKGEVEEGGSKLLVKELQLPTTLLDRLGVSLTNFVDGAIIPTVSLMPGFKELYATANTLSEKISLFYSIDLQDFLQRTINEHFQIFNVLNGELIFEGYFDSGIQCVTEPGSPYEYFENGRNPYDMQLTEFDQETIFGRQEVGNLLENDNSTRSLRVVTALRLYILTEGSSPSHRAEVVQKLSQHFGLGIQVDPSSFADLRTSSRLDLLYFLEEYNAYMRIIGSGSTGIFDEVA